MPRRNLLTIFLVLLVSLFCYQRVEHNRYGRYLAQVLDVIDDQALERIDQQELFNGAMHGIVAQLNQRIDENSSFISAKEREKFEADLEQEFGGVGVMIKLEGDETDEKAPKQLVVVNPPIVGTPAAREGVRVRDKITAIDDKPTAGMAMNDVIDAMRGPVGSKVDLTVVHEGAKEPVTLTLKRDVISVPSVLGDRQLPDGAWDFWVQADPRIGLLRVTTFGEKTMGELTSALEALKEDNIQALVLDLRDDTGGRLDTAVEMCRLFLHAGEEIVSIRARDDEVKEEYESLVDGPYCDLPLAVLINGRSASASEIVAACLQDNKRATIIGTRSYGKGTVQHLIRIESGKSLLKLTAAKYWRPSEKNIHRPAGAKPEDEWGVLPDPGFLMERTEKEEERRYKERNRRDLVEPTPPPKDEDSTPADPQLERAVEELRRQLRADESKASAA